MIRTLLIWLALVILFSVSMGWTAKGCDDGYIDNGDIQTFDVAPLMTVAGGYSDVSCGVAAVQQAPVVYQAPARAVVIRRAPVVVQRAPVVYGRSVGRGIAVGRGVGYASAGGVGGGSIQAGRAVRLRNNVVNGAAPFQIQGGRRVKLKNNIFN